MILRPLCLVALLLAAAPARAGDPLPAAVAVSVIAVPAPIVQEGEPKLFYELVLTNYAPSPYELEAIEAEAGASKASAAGDAGLAPLIRRLGAKPGASLADPRRIEAGASIVLFLQLDLRKGETPAAIHHVLQVKDAEGRPHEIVPPPVAISREKPIVVAAPLRGDWIAGDSVHNGPDAAHRRALMVEGGHPWIAQRYAIDWVQTEEVEGKRTTWKGPEDKNESYFCWDKPIYSVAAGTVVAASDGLAENVPHSGKHVVALTFANAAGNHAVIEIAPQRYVLYAHMRPGSVAVKTGDKVAAGQVIGHVGNTGSSEEPHMHMHIDDRPSFLGGNGVPYEFARGTASGPVVANVSSSTAVAFGPIGPQKPFVDDYPAENALVTFK